MRLDKFLSENTKYSRSQIRKFAKSGAISVNECVQKAASLHINKGDKVNLNGEPVLPLENIYCMLYKPPGYVCANTDSDHPTVFDLIFMSGVLAPAGEQHNLPKREALQMEKLQIAGRLDKETTGLLLLTNDGDWNHRVTSPNRHCGKTYLVELDRQLDQSVVKKFAEGIQLDGEKTITRPAELIIYSEKSATLRLHEGKYHQVKRMFAAVGNHVTKLHRESIGAIKLDIAEGQLRRLTASEIENF